MGPDGRPQCTISGVCGLTMAEADLFRGGSSTAAAAAAADVLASGGSSTSGGATDAATIAVSSSDSSTMPGSSEDIGSGDVASTSSPPAAVNPGAPRITLLGARRVQIPQWGGWERCLHNASSTSTASICDLGATADDPKEGNLDHLVKVCGQPFQASSFNVSSSLPPTPPGNASLAASASSILQACNIPAGVPGQYTVTYSVANSAGLGASTLRHLTVMPICPAGERLCSDMVRALEATGCSA